MVNVVDTGDGTFDFGTGDLKWIIVPSQWGDSWVSIGSTSANSMICADIYYDGEPQNLSFNAPTKGDIVLGSAPVSFGNTFTLEVIFILTEHQSLTLTVRLQVTL